MEFCLPTTRCPQTRTIIRALVTVACPSCCFKGAVRRFLTIHMCLIVKRKGPFLAHPSFLVLIEPTVLHCYRNKRRSDMQIIRLLVNSPSYSGVFDILDGRGE